MTKFNFNLMIFIFFIAVPLLSFGHAIKFKVMTDVFPPNLLFQLSCNGPDRAETLSLDSNWTKYHTVYTAHHGIVSPRGKWSCVVQCGGCDPTQNYTKYSNSVSFDLCDKHNGDILFNFSSSQKSLDVSGSADYKC